MSSVNDLPPMPDESSGAGISDLPPMPSDPSVGGGTNQTPGFWALASKINGGSNPLNQPADSMLADPEGTKMQAKIGAGLALGAIAGPMAEGAGFLSRAGVNAGAAGIQKLFSNQVDQKSDPTEGVIGNTAVGGGLSVGADALGGIYDGVKNVIQTGKWAANPAEMQDAALAAISDATAKLKNSQSASVAQQLEGKTVKVDTTQLKGIDPKIDAILAPAANQYGQIPSEAEIPAVDANNIRRIIDGKVSYKVLGPYAQNAQEAAADAALSAKADVLRGQIHGISPELNDTFEQWSDAMGQAQNLGKRAETAPVNVLTSPSIDRRALLQKVDDAVGTNLVGLGSQMNDAKNLSNAVHQIQPMKALGAVALTSGKGAAPAIAAGNALSNPSLIQGVAATSPGSSGPISYPANQINPSTIGNAPASNDVAKTPATTGPDAWAAQGIQKLGIKDTSVSARLLQDPKAKQLLIQASDLAPNSKAMNQIMSQLQKGWGTT